MDKLMGSKVRSFLFLAVLLALPDIAASQSTPIQPIFRFPLEAGYRSLCTQGNNGSVSHHFNSTLYDLDFDTPNAGQPQDPQPVVAAADGIAYTYGGCVFGDWSCNDSFGNHVKISHGSNVFSIYAHLSSISVNNGQRVRAGERIGVEGSTGESRDMNGRPADHLHFGIHVGNAQRAPVGTSVPLEQIGVINVTDNSGVQFLGGGDFTCGLPGGDYYTFGEVPVCHTLTSQQPVPNGYGATYDVFSAQKELLLKATCALTDTRISIGYNNEQTFIYDIGYQWLNNQWQQIKFQCIGAKPYDTWCQGEAIGVISDQASYFAAYTCRSIGGVWKCGCRDQQCTQSFWQLQNVE